MSVFFHSLRRSLTFSHSLTQSHSVSVALSLSRSLALSHMLSSLSGIPLLPLVHLTSSLPFLSSELAAPPQGHRSRLCLGDRARVSGHRRRRDWSIPPPTAVCQPSWCKVEATTCQAATMEGGGVVGDHRRVSGPMFNSIVCRVAPVAPSCGNGDGAHRRLS